MVSKKDVILNYQAFLLCIPFSFGMYTWNKSDYINKLYFILQSFCFNLIYVAFYSNLHITKTIKYGKLN